MRPQQTVKEKIAASEIQKETNLGKLFEMRNKKETRKRERRLINRHIKRLQEKENEK